MFPFLLEIYNFITFILMKTKTSVPSYVVWWLKSHNIWYLKTKHVRENTNKCIKTFNRSHPNFGELNWPPYYVMTSNNCFRISSIALNNHLVITLTFRNWVQSGNCLKIILYFIKLHDLNLFRTFVSIQNIHNILWPVT